MKIIDLHEISPNTWKALYSGNYGTYTIKIKTDGRQTTDFSCSCPSDYYPCKHIAMIEEAIRERIAKSSKTTGNDEMTVNQILKDVSQKELYDFVVRHAQYNPQFKNAVLLEFAHKSEKKDANPYTQILRNKLDGLYFDYEDVYDYHEEAIEIDVLDQWLDKARKHADEGNTGEAILICKACIEEYAEWYDETDCEVIDYIDESYQDRPFEILKKIIAEPGVDCKELFEYCKSEMTKQKYKNAHMDEGFSDLFCKLSVIVGSDDFIEMQDKLLHEITDKSSWEAKKILQRKIDFYRNNNQFDKAFDIIKSNVQIETFREELTKKLIGENKLQEAKKLIDDFISKQGNENNHRGSWYELKLQIAQKEKDVEEIRRLSYRFIESSFSANYYKIYKSTFAKEEWAGKVEKLIELYQKRNPNWFYSSVAMVLQAEKQEERLMQYVEKHLDIDKIEEYHTSFSATFPEKTVSLFRKAIDKYAESTGRDVYERISDLFKKMVKIEGGSNVVREMIERYRAIYKNRRAMMEILNKFKH